MEFDGKTYLVFDKYAGNHNINNSLTVNITVNDIFSDPKYTHFNGTAAIEESTKIFKSSNYALPNDLDLTFYDANVFTTKLNEIDCTITMVGVNNEMLHDCVSNKKTIPNNDFIKQLCRFHILYSKATAKNKVNEGCTITTTDNEVIEYNTDEIIAEAIENVDHLTDPIIPDPDFVKVKLYNYQKE